MYTMNRRSFLASPLSASTGTAAPTKKYRRFYGSGTPGLGIEINEELAAKNPLEAITDGSPYPLDRTMDGALVEP